jgi:putative oxidoreductase
MKATTSNVQRSTLNAQLAARTSLGVGRWTLDVGRFPVLRITMQILAFIIAAIFIFAALIKILDIDQLVIDVIHLRFAAALQNLKHLSLRDPVGFARDIDNYNLLPWPVAVVLALYLPWLEIFSGLALVTRRLYRGGLLILTLLTTVFIAASIVAKARGLDISCGCFGHVSKGWSFGWHLLLDFGILGALVTLLLQPERLKTSARESRE